CGRSSETPAEQAWTMRMARHRRGSISGNVPRRRALRPAAGRWLFPFLCVPSFVAWFLEIPQQPLDVVELELRAEAFAEAPAQFFQNAPRALHVDLARHLDRGVVAVLAPAQGPPERVALLLGARPPEPAGLAVGAGIQHALLLHRLGEVLRAAA